jgi:hypothetical protein
MVLKMSDAQTEAWIRKKPKRIIHNQLLIQILIVVSVLTPVSASGLVLWLIFSFYPRIVIPAIIVVWAMVSVVYVSLRLWVMKQNRKH